LLVEVVFVVLVVVVLIEDDVVLILEVDEDTGVDEVRLEVAVEVVRVADVVEEPVQVDGTLKSSV
jgi:hypothetical protein